MPVSSTVEIPAQTGVAMRLRPGETLCIIDPYGKQVADLAMFDGSDVREAFSPGRTMDYNQSVRLGPGDALYSNRSGELAHVVEDSVGVHDMLLSPCSETMFARRGEFAHRSCHANLTAALAPFGICSDAVTVTLNVFMDVRVQPEGQIAVLPPASSAGDRFTIVAARDLIVGLAACSSERTNGGSCKPIAYERRLELRPA